MGLLALILFFFLSFVVPMKGQGRDRKKTELPTLRITARGTSPVV
jgi:hypothetical protein